MALIWLPGETIFSLLAHLLIVVIGTLSGFELPLLMAVFEKRAKELDHSLAERSTLSLSYLGAFAATVVFAFWFFPRVGIVATAFVVAMLNAAVALLLAVSDHDKSPSKMKSKSAVHVVLLLAFLLCWTNSDRAEEFFVSHYLAGSTHN